MGSNDELIDNGGTNFRKAFALFNAKVETPRNEKVRRNFVVSKLFFLTHSMFFVLLIPHDKIKKLDIFCWFLGGKVL